MPQDASDVRVKYDHHSAENAAKSWPILAGLRQKCPVAWTEAHGGYWVVSRHIDVIVALRNWPIFSSRHDHVDMQGGFGGQAIPPNPFRTSLAESDPPYSLTIRELLTPEFSATRIAANRAVIHRIAAECLEAVAEAGTVDLVADFVNQVPAKVTLALIGMEPDEWHRYAPSYA